MHNDKDLRGSLPLTPAEEQAQEAQSGKCEAVEVIIDNDYISIPRSRYDELLKIEAQLDVVHRFYGIKGSGYQMADLMEALFGPRGDGDNA